MMQFISCECVHHFNVKNELDQSLNRRTIFISELIARSFSDRRGISPSMSYRARYSPNSDMRLKY